MAQASEALQLPMLGPEQDEPARAGHGDSDEQELARPAESCAAERTRGRLRAGLAWLVVTPCFHYHFLCNAKI